MQEIISDERIVVGTNVMVSLYRAPGDIYDGWDVGPSPDARYGPDSGDTPVESTLLGPFGVVEERLVVTDRDGWSYRRVYLLADGEELTDREA
jgi:hypothetical protein